MSFKLIKYGDPVAGAEKAIEDINLEKVINIVKEAKSLSPVVTSRMKNDMQYATPTEKGGREGADKTLSVRPKKGEAFVGNTVPYAWYVNFGTKHQKAQRIWDIAIAIAGFGKDVSETLKLANKAMKEKVVKGRVKTEFF